MQLTCMHMHTCNMHNNNNNNNNICTHVHVWPAAIHMIAGSGGSMLDWSSTH